VAPTIRGIRREVDARRISHAASWVDSEHRRLATANAREAFVSEIRAEVSGTVAPDADNDGARSVPDLFS